MAVTRVYEPFAIVNPAHNDLEFRAVSDQIAQPNFIYYVTVTISGDTYVYKIPPAPDGQCDFNARSIAEKYVKNYYPFQINGWQEVIDGYKTMVVNIGEFYGSTPTVHTGTNVTINVWNGSLSLKQRRTYRDTDYSTNAKWLNNYPLVSTVDSPVATIDRNHDMPFFFLDPGKVITKVRISTWTYIGGVIGAVATVDVANSTGKEYICINLSPASINALLGGGSPFNGTEDFYIVEFFTIAGGTTSVQNAIIFIADPCPVSMVNNNRWVFYQNKLGAYDFIDTKLTPTKGININRTFYKSVVPALSQASSYFVVGSTNENGINPLPANQKILSSTYEYVETMNSEWLTNKQVEDVADLFTTSSAFIQEAANDYNLKLPADSYYEYRNEYLEKNVKLVLKFNSVNTEVRQHE